MLPSVLWRCWLGSRKGIRPVKTEWWGAGVVIGLERGADLHMAQLMPLPLTVSCSSKIQIGFTFPVPTHLGSPGQRAVKRMYVWCMFLLFLETSSQLFRMYQWKTSPSSLHFSGCFQANLGWLVPSQFSPFTCSRRVPLWIRGTGFYWTNAFPTTETTDIILKESQKQLCQQ